MLPPRPVLAALLAATALLGACGGNDTGPTSGDKSPEVGVRGERSDAAGDLGFPSFATKNTTRVGGADPVANAAAVARAVHPGAETRPKAVTLVDKADWHAGVAAAALVAAPVGAPILLSDGQELPAATKAALDALAPTGSAEAGDAQVIRVGDVARVEGRKSTDVTGKDPAELAARIDAFTSAARGRTSSRVIIAGIEKPEFALPAAGWSAKSGDPVLFTARDALPVATREAIVRHDRPTMYILGDESIVSAKVETALRKLGTVKRIDAGGPDPIASAIAFARYIDGAFGWGVVDPGHGLVFVNATRPLDAAAATSLSASGTYGPILLHRGGQLPRTLESYLLDIQPGYRRDPVRGVYNHGWLIGDEAALPVASQARIDALLEITEIKTETTESRPSS